MQNALTRITCNATVYTTLTRCTRVPFFPWSFLEICKSLQVVNLEGAVSFCEPGALLCCDVGDCAQKQLHHVGDCVRDVDHAVLRDVVVGQSLGKGADTEK